MHVRWSRRQLLAAPLALGVLGDVTTPAGSTATPWIMAPIGWPGAMPGDGFQIGHGFQCENSWFSPGWWHTGEDWYATSGDTAGAEVRAVASGEVVYADYNYPGRVVIVQHATDLFSLYGHLEFELAVATGERIEPGTVLGTILPQGTQRGLRKAPSHLHFEIRRFLIRDDVNGSAPSHGVHCGFQCPPGPGYWPISANDLPVDKGWLNPLHERITQAIATGPDGLAIRAQAGATGTAFPLRSAPEPGAAQAGVVSLEPGATTSVFDITVGESGMHETGATAYTLWLRVGTEGQEPGWLQAAIPSEREVGSDGRPSAVDLPFILVRE